MLKNEQLVGHRGSAPMNDFQYQLSDLGRERGRRYTQHCTYFGAAPVSLQDYIASVHAQSLTNQRPTVDDLARAFDGLLLSKDLLDRLGPAINSGRGLFLFGPPGNGKTSIAERMTAAFGQEIWIPARRRHRRRYYSPLRSGDPRGGPLAADAGIARQAQDRQALDPHSTAHDRRRRRADDVATWK